MTCPKLTDTICRGEPCENRNEEAGLTEWQRVRADEVYPDGSKVLLAVEVISLSNRPTPLREKVAICVERGIETWVVEPKKREVKVHRRGERLVSGSLRVQSVLQWNGKAVPPSAIFRLS